MAKLHRSIRIMEASGAGDRTPSMLFACQKATDIMFQAKEFGEALKFALKTRYFIEPAQEPALQLPDRLSTLLNIILLLQFQSPDEAAEVIAIRDPILLHLKAKYISYITKCFDGDSIVGKYELSSLDRFLDELLENRGNEFTQRVLHEDGTELCVPNMNKLLKWAQFEERTLEQFLE